MKDKECKWRAKDSKCNLKSETKCVCCSDDSNCAWKPSDEVMKFCHQCDSSILRDHSRYEDWTTSEQLAFCSIGCYLTWIKKGTPSDK